MPDEPGDAMSTYDSSDDQRTTRDRRGGADVKPPKTSAAAVFALVFGLISLFAALLALLAPLAVVFGLIGLVLGIVGISKAKHVNVTGKGVAIGGLVLSVIGLLLGVALLIGVTIFANFVGLDQLEQRIQDVRGEIPTELPEP
jgi:hypothetical protein